MNLGITTAPGAILSTAGAVPVRNEKGEISMQKVKVSRYISGKRPEYARSESSDSDSDAEDFVQRKRANEQRRTRRTSGGDDNDDDRSHRQQHAHAAHDDDDDDEEEIDDPRLRRLRARPLEHTDEEGERDRRVRYRHIQEPEFLATDSDEAQSDVDSNDQLKLERKTNKITLDSESDDNADLSETELQQRRQKLRQRMMQLQKEEEVLKKEEEVQQSDLSETESSEYDEETDSEEDHEPRLKPLFVSKRERATIQEKEREAQRQKQLEIEAKRAAKERRRATLRIVEESVKKDLEKIKPDTAEASIEDVCTDDDNDEVEYEAWKLRELKRMKRDREEREGAAHEKAEIERLRNMTEEERRAELRLNPKVITNKAVKGKYKFLQKYYHRGAFYLDEENDVLKRDFAQPTLEDHFDKTILPKVMQVKTFGRCGRTKYTHLVDQDTTKFDSPWCAETANNIKFHNDRAGGMKQVFDRPSLSKRNKSN